MTLDLRPSTDTDTDTPPAAPADRPAVAAMPAAAPVPPAIRTVDVSRVYKLRGEKRARGAPPKTLTALDHVNLEVPAGELFGLLGPNGAGKTTLIKILTTLLAPSGGTCYVDGYDVVRQADEVRRRINMVSGGETSGYGLLTVTENLWMFSQFYGVPTREAHAAIAEMLTIVDLQDKANARVSSLSTGQRQRMNFCRGFVTDPRVIFLDEPTLGLDVNAARLVRDFTRDWMRRYPDRTVLLTTHYMAEADELCDRIAIIDHGAVLACDTPANLKRRLQKQPIFEIQAAGIGPQHLPALERAAGVIGVSGEGGAGTNVYTLKFVLEDEAAIGAVVGALTAQQGRILTLQKNEPTLEDVFVRLVGHGLEAEA